MRCGGHRITLREAGESTLTHAGRESAFKYIHTRSYMSLKSPQFGINTQEIPASLKVNTTIHLKQPKVL